MPLAAKMAQARSGTQQSTPGLSSMPSNPYSGQQPQYGQPPPGIPQYGHPPGVPQYTQPPGVPQYGQPPGTPQYGQSPVTQYGQPQGLPQYGQQFSNQTRNYGQQPYGQPQYGQQSGHTPYPSQTGAFPPYPGQPGGFGYGGPPGQYGRPGQQGSGQYGQPGPGAPHDIQGYQRQLEDAIRQKNLGKFPISQRVPQIAARAVEQVDRVCQAWRIPQELAADIVRLALYDIILFIDDSGSMSFEEDGERIKDLEVILQRVAFASTLFDDDGIEIRFMNDEDGLTPNMLSNIRSEQQVKDIISRKRYKGLTPFGTKLREKVIDPLIISKLKGSGMQKPILVIGITDGQPTDGPNALPETIRYAVNAAANSPFGEGAIAFQFAQVGNDQKATEYLARLDNDPVVGRSVDCTSNFENESAEMAKAQPPVELTPETYMLKLVLGAIDPSYDTKDEKTHMIGSQSGGPPSYGQPAPGGYGQPAPGSHGPPAPGGYGQPAPGGYGQPYGQVPPGVAYPGQQPPGGGYPQSGGYPGQHPPGGGYPGQQGAYQPPRY
ncbi:hypothetical protein K470DRAFT_248233 [Piedraia hortae CBS 480.64]|uniref:VWFA domain-containing protein n=1 Tax=Piedraia hortae CBS 480.64 TaxID=1314780 RepID=A0A6A7BXN8_9PEZI|nr:hypothetical protein K470DRAFT_248233 [Piedraia hortae CBS 480.64]